MGNDTNTDKGPKTPVTPMPVDPDAVTTSSLQALQSADQRRVMDIVDKLRRTGLSGVVELPQLIVCGDQSSGKSSVLEAITEIPFPRKENLCTRFATDIILRRSPASTSTVTITPDKLRPESEQAKLKGFTKSIQNFDQLPDVIEEATLAMGLGVVGGISSRAFSRDVLSVEITGPSRPQLTLVDLPGLIHATNKAQTEADKELILDLVSQYMKNPRTIILAVNKDIYLERGWHMLKNRADNQMNFSFDQRNKDEALFFSKGRYAELPRECVGITSLRERLSKVLLHHLIRELPSLKEEMVTKYRATLDEISNLGEKRNTSHEQRVFLMKISMKVNDILKSATKGYYESPFFGTINKDAAVDSAENIRRFRAVVQHLNMGFAKDMRLRGHRYNFEAGPGDDERDCKESLDAQRELERELKQEKDGTKYLPVPQKLSRAEAVEWVKKTLERSRGYELPGTFQPVLISQLFWEQSLPWEDLASLHIAKVAQVCRDFIDVVLADCVPEEFKERLVALTVDAALSKSLGDAKEELAKVLKDKARHPSTYNHYFTSKVQKMRLRKHQALTKAATSAAKKQEGEKEKQRTVIDPIELAAQLDRSIELDMDTFSSQEALDMQRAYYKDELGYFINAVAKAVIERHLVEPLPEIILSPLVVAQMTDEQVEYVAAEPLELTQQRAHLEARKAMLEKGLETFRGAMGGVKR
ncbi:P-loop containing nucleoside triphosphate hydrolase protein [Bipolaris maydis]|nr:P-loop containing nucleoside triphosphate hydrolase protein [Bipolaris maydis]